MQNSQLGLVLIVVLVIVVIWVWSRCQLKCTSSEYYGMGAYSPGMGVVAPTHAANTHHNNNYGYPRMYSRDYTGCGKDSYEDDYKDPTGMKNYRGRKYMKTKKYEDEEDSEYKKSYGLAAPRMKACPPGYYYEHKTQNCRVRYPIEYRGYEKETVKASIPGSTLSSYGVGITTPYDVKTDVVIY